MFMRNHSSIVSILFSNVNFTRVCMLQWKSTLTQASTRTLDMPNKGKRGVKQNNHYLKGNGS